MPRGAPSSVARGWASYLEWAAASRLNEVEWLLLWAEGWADYALSADRQARFRILVDMCHNFTIRAGADAAIALQQQVLARIALDHVLTRPSTRSRWSTARDRRRRSWRPSSTASTGCSTLALI